MKTENQRIKEWNEERGLIKTPKDINLVNEFSFIVEEILEGLTNLKSEEAREYAKTLTKTIASGNIKYLCDLIEEHNLDIEQDGGDEIIPLSNDEVVDALCDIKVFASGSIRKLGYDADIAMDETLKEIESRVGKQIDGKFVKDKSDEAKAKWYKADYSLAIVETL